MSETWEETKARLRKQGIGLPAERGATPEPEPEIIIETPKARYDEPVKEAPKVPLYEIRKITLPPSKKHEHGKVVVYGVTAAEADWWIEYKLKTKVFHDDNDETKTLVFYEKFLIDGTPKERSIYSNPARFCTEDFPEFNNPRRIN